MRGRWYVPLTFMVLLGSAVPLQSALAQAGKPDMAAAKKAFKAGAKAMQGQDYVTAVLSFKKAFEITKDGLVMGHVATAYEKAGDYEAALAAIKIYQAALPTKDQASVDQLVKKYEAAIKAGKSKKLVFPAEAKPVEAKPVEAKPVEAKPAEVKPEEAKPEETGEEGQGETGEGDETGADEGEEQEKKGKRFYTWIAAGGAAALALSGLVVGLNAQSEFDEAHVNCKGPDLAKRKLCTKTAQDSVRTRALVADVLFSVAAGAAITAGVLYFLEGRSSEGEPQEETSRTKLRITPVAGGGTFGLSADLKF